MSKIIFLKSKYANQALCLYVKAINIFVVILINDVGNR